MDISLPSRCALKAQAKRLRAGLADTGQPITHAQALEAVAHQWGARDWNTLHAMAKDTPQQHYAPKQPVTGLYLGHRFKGTIKAANAKGGGYWALTLVFDEAIDVVTSDHFSSFRKQVMCTIGPNGQTVQKTSDGQPHVVIDHAWNSPH